MILDDAFDPEHLNIAFHRLQPELLLASMRPSSNTDPGLPPEWVSSGEWGTFPYQHYATAYAGMYRTDDEARYLEQHFRQRSRTPEGRLSVFELLRRCSADLLTTSGGDLQCRYGRVLAWRKASLCLSQDLFTTAYAASEDLAGNSPPRRDFVWPDIIDTDNSRLADLLSRGLSENHFHLSGSTRMFTLSWVCMMNHPELIHEYFTPKVREHFRDRLNQALTIGPNIRPLSWQEVLMYGAWLRANLFRAFLAAPRQSDGSGSDADLVQSFLDFDAQPEKQLTGTKDLVEALRCDTRAVKLLQRNGARIVLDYALTEDLTDCHDSNYRILAGERHLLYTIFRRIFAGEVPERVQDCFYLYLLLQNQFRSELIQVNERIGFQNFGRYQDRKEFFWENCPGYEDESMRLSINAVLEKGNIRSLEARTIPRVSDEALIAKIKKLDSAYIFAETDCPPKQAQLDIVSESPLYYILHFPKNTLEEPDNAACYPHFLPYPRNSKVRSLTRKQSQAIADALSKSAYLRGRVRAIDACANEIGCRPESFATDFRFLRSGIRCVPSHPFEQLTESTFYLQATYHAGEDFIDLLDGLRAIDEARRFLDLRSGDRLGHALALGVDPQSYYSLKKLRLIIPRQDLLDNMVWLLHRCRDLDVPIPDRLRNHLESGARELMDGIGYGSKRFSLQQYDQAWSLRGDHPSVYLPDWTENTFRLQDNSYESFWCPDDSDLTDRRRDGDLRELMRLYHFDRDIRRLGSEVVSYRIEPGMAKLVEQLQNRMQHQLRDLGIAIESNPSSNVLIGSFDKYRDHPMFRFNHKGLRIPRWDQETQAELCVSLNTDDQGVFDTSLESEYAFVASCLERELDENGDRINSDDAIYTYLEHLRTLGNSQTFHPGRDTLFSPNARSYSDFRNQLRALSLSFP